MRRFSMLPVVATLLASVLLGGGAMAVSAQEQDATASPVVGTWVVAHEPADLSLGPSTLLLADDGSAVAIFVTTDSPEGAAALGTWAATGETSADVTFVLVTNGPAQIVIRAAIEVSADGASFDGTFTQEMVFDPAGGGTSGEIGPGTWTGTRVTAEGPGEAVSSFEDFFAVPGETPEATPVP